MNENFRIFEFDDHYHSKNGALYLADGMGLKITEYHLTEIALRRQNLGDYGFLSDPQVFATTLDSDQMVKFRESYPFFPDPPIELIKPFKTSEPPESIGNMAS